MCFLDQNPLKKRSAKVADEWSTFFCGTNIFSQTIQFHDISAKNYLILNAKRNVTNQGPKIWSFVLDRVAKWAIFVLNRVTDLEGFSDTPRLKLPLKSPPPPPWPLNIPTKKWTMESGEGVLHMKGVGMLIVSLRGVNFGFWSNLGCSNQNVNDGEMQKGRLHIWIQVEKS